MRRQSEDELIATLFAPLAGPGGLALTDDAALVNVSLGRDLVVTKDVLVAGVHFFPGDPAGAIARKALRVNISDLAAKGATPRGFLLGLALPSDWTHEWLTAFALGLGEDAADFACPLLGGDTVTTPGPLTISITAFGEIEAGHMVARGAAQNGDLLYVSGTIGDAAIGLRLRLDGREDAPWIGVLAHDAATVLTTRYLLPQPRPRLADALRTHATAAMDVSDGLAGDLAKMLRLAGLTANIAVDRVPISSAARAAIALMPTLLGTALTGGDDYEILCAIPPKAADAFEADAAHAGIAVSRIGAARAGKGEPVFHNAAGAALAFTSARFVHF